MRPAKPWGVAGSVQVCLCVCVCVGADAAETTPKKKNYINCVIMGSTVCKREAMQAKQLTTLFVYTNTLSHTHRETLRQSQTIEPKSNERTSCCKLTKA